MPCAVHPNWFRFEGQLAPPVYLFRFGATAAAAAAEAKTTTVRWSASIVWFSGSAGAAAANLCVRLHLAEVSPASPARPADASQSNGRAKERPESILISFSVYETRKFSIRFDSIESIATAGARPASCRPAIVVPASTCCCGRPPGKSFAWLLDQSGGQAARRPARLESAYQTQND